MQMRARAGRKINFQTLPLALMKISAWHKQKGDTVEWWEPLENYDRV